MFAEQWSKVVLASVAPAVVISASALLCLAFYNRLAAIVSRLRSVQRERLHELAACRGAAERGDDVATRRHKRLLENLGQQTAHITERGRLIRFTLLCLLAAVGLLIVSSLLNGAALFWPEVAFSAAICFGGGMLSVLAGVATAVAELRSSLDVVELESAFVSTLADDAVELGMNNNFKGEERSLLGAV